MLCTRNSQLNYSSFAHTNGSPSTRESDQHRAGLNSSSNLISTGTSAYGQLTNKIIRCLAHSTLADSSSPANFHGIAERNNFDCFNCTHFSHREQRKHGCLVTFLLSAFMAEEKVQKLSNWVEFFYANFRFSSMHVLAEVIGLNPEANQPSGAKYLLWPTQ